MANCLSLVLAALLVSISAAAQQDVPYERANPAECESINYMEYASNNLGDFVSCSTESCSYKVQAATTFSIEYRPEYKVIRFTESGETEATRSEQTSVTYILYQCAQQEPSDEYIRSLVHTRMRTFVQVPLTAVVTGDSTVGWALDELELEDRVRFAGRTATTPCLIKIGAPEADGGCGREYIREDGEEPRTSIDAYDAEFTFNGQERQKGIVYQASADPDPLGRAEKIIYLSAFFDKEEAGLNFFGLVQRRYRNTQVQGNETSPIVAWVTTANFTDYGYTNAQNMSIAGEGVQISFARYKAALTLHAGGRMPPRANIGGAANGDDVIFAMSEYEDRAAMYAAVAEVLRGVDVLIDETYHPDGAAATVEGLRMALGLQNATAEEYSFLENSIWRHDKARTENGQDDWFGEAIARPDMVLLDLRSVVEGNVRNNTYFFRSLSAGQSTETRGSDSCENLECTSYATQEPIMVDIESDDEPQVVTSSSSTFWGSAAATLFGAILMGL